MTTVIARYQFAHPDGGVVESLLPGGRQAARAGAVVDALLGQCDHLLRRPVVPIGCLELARCADSLVLGLVQTAEQVVTAVMLRCHERETN